MDRKWWHQYALTISGEFELWTSHPEAARVYRLNFIRSEPGGGLSKTPGTIRQGGNSGFQAVALALHFGAARVILLGYDMQFTNGRSHWHGDHSVKLGNPVPERMRFWHEQFRALGRETTVPIVNATRETALRCFPRVTLAEALCGVRG